MLDAYANRYALCEQLKAAAEAHAAEVAAQLNRIPAYLQRFDRWGFYTPDKVAVSLNGINSGWPGIKEPDPYHRLDKPDTWASFAGVLASLTPGGRASALKVISGPTMALTADMGVIVIDLDPVERNLPRGAQDDPELLATRMAFGREVTRWILNWADQVGAYVERSSSGKGWHIAVRGTFVAYKYEIGWFGHIIRQDQHIHMTGDRVAGGDLVLAQTAVDELIGFLLQRSAIRELKEPDRSHAALGLLETYGRRLDLTDAEAVARLRLINKRSFEALHSRNFGGDWSAITWQIIGDLDRVTGDPEQVSRILFGSERLRFAGTSKDRVDRYRRTSDDFNYILAKARVRNDEKMAFQSSVRFGA